DLRKRQKAKLLMRRCDEAHCLLRDILLPFRPLQASNGFRNGPDVYLRQGSSEAEEFYTSYCSAQKFTNPEREQSHAVDGSAIDAQAPFGRKNHHALYAAFFA